MANSPYSTVGGYGGNASVLLDPNTGLSAFVDDLMDGVPTLHPQINANGFLSSLVIDPTSPAQPFYGAYPELNAILVELRVLSALIREQMGNTGLSFDLQTMRADEAWNTNVLTGAL
jgi:hypothetical protein